LSEREESYIAAIAWRKRERWTDRQREICIYVYTYREREREEEREME